jgi:hypothetical protein
VEDQSLDNSTEIPTENIAEVVNMPTNLMPDDILGYANEYTDKYEQTDIFHWSNNLVQYVDEIKIELFFFNRNMTPYRLKIVGDAAKQLRPLFMDNILEYVLGGLDKGLSVRGFEEAEQEDNVLQYTKVANVKKLLELLNWLKHEKQNIEEFNDTDHDIKRMKGVVAVCSHREFKTFYIVKNLPTSQIMKGHTAWTLKDGAFKPFDTISAIKIPDDNQLLVASQDLFVFSQSKLKSLFGYDAKAASIAEKKVLEIESNFKLSFAAGGTLQSLIEGKSALIKKLQKIEPGLIKQDALIDHADEMGIELMVDDAGAIIIMDDKDLTRFINLLNDDYIESPMTGQKYEILKKRNLKPPSDQL